MSDYDLVIFNFANPDMVGHTGVVQAGVKAVETIDKCSGGLCLSVLALGGKALITADHGNCEQMRNSDGSPNTGPHSNLVISFTWLTMLPFRSKTESWRTWRQLFFSARTPTTDGNDRT